MVAPQQQLRILLALTIYFTNLYCCNSRPHDVTDRTVQCLSPDAKVRSCPQPSPCLLQVTVMPAQRFSRQMWRFFYYKLSCGKNQLHKQKSYPKNIFFFPIWTKFIIINIFYAINKCIKSLFYDFFQRILNWIYFNSLNLTNISYLITNILTIKGN